MFGEFVNCGLNTSPLCNKNVYSLSGCNQDILFSLRRDLEFATLFLLFLLSLPNQDKFVYFYKPFVIFEVVFQTCQDFKY